MAGTRIRGITIELSGDASKLNEALNGVNKALKNTQSQLKDVDKLLKLDPKNTELLQQKQGLLSDAIAQTKQKIDEEKKALEALKASPEADKTIEQQRALERDIIATTQSLDAYEKEADETADALKELNGEAKDTADAIDETGKASKTSAEKLEDFGNKAQAVADKTRALSAAGAAVTGALIANAVHSAKAADDLATLSQQTGFTVEELQKMQYASDLVDVSVDTMTGSVKKLTNNMKNGAAVFDTLGINIYNADGSMRDATAVWYDALDALSKIQNETERDALSMELFGKSAMDMAGIVDDGGAALRAYGEEAQNAGIIMSGDTVAAAVEFNNALDKIKATLQGGLLQLGASLAETLTPALETVVAKVTEIVQWFTQLDGSTQQIILIVAALVAAISPIASLIAAITTAATGLSAAFTFLTGPIGAIGLAIAALIAFGVMLYTHWDEISAKAKEIWGKITETFNQVKEKITGAIQTARDNVAKSWDNMKEKTATAAQNIRDKAATAFSWVKDKADALKTKITDIFDKIKYAITHPFEAAWDIVSGIVDKLKSIFNFEWSLPHIALPHFRVDGGQWPYGIGGRGYMPSFGVEWYARAMKNGVILNNPTIFGMNNGTLLGAGEAGSETIVGTNSLMDMIREAAASSGPVINMTVNGAGMNPEELSAVIIDKITNQIKRTNQRW